MMLLPFFDASTSSSAQGVGEALARGLAVGIGEVLKFLIISLGVLALCAAIIVVVIILIVHRHHKVKKASSLPGDKRK